MPTVPSDFLPSVGSGNSQELGGFTAPAVEPMRSYAGEQEQQFGDATVRAGDAAMRVGMTIRDSIDEAAAKDADVQFLQASQNVLHGQNGYLNTRGKDAVDGFQQANESLSAAANATLDGLQNDTQKKMFTQVAARNMIAFKGQMMEHHNRESISYATSASEARISSYVPLAVNASKSRNEVDPDGNPVGAFNTYVGVVMSEVRNIGKLQGYEIDSPQMKELETKAWGQITTGVVERLSLNGDYKSALDYVNEQNKAGRLDERTAETLLSHATSNRKRQMSIEYADNVIDKGELSSYAGGGYTMPVESSTASVVKPPEGTVYNDLGIDISAAPGTPVKAPTDGVVTAIDERDGKYSLTLQLKDGTLAKMEGLASKDMAWRGQSFMAGTVLSTMGEDPMHYSMSRLKDGETDYFDPQNGNNADIHFDRAKALPPVSERDAIGKAAVLKEQDPDLWRETVQQIKHKYAEKAQLEHQESQNMELQAVRFMAQPIQVAPAAAGGQAKTREATVNDLPPALRNAMNPLVLERLDKDQKSRNDPAFELFAAQNPSALNADLVMSQNISASLKAKYLNEINKPDPAVAMDMTDWKATLNQNGLGQLVDPPRSEKENVDMALRLTNSVRDRIAFEQGEKKKPLSRDEKHEIMIQEIKNAAHTHTEPWLNISNPWSTPNNPLIRFGGGDTVGMPVGTMTEEETTSASFVAPKGGHVSIMGEPIPSEDYRLIRDALSTKDNPNPTVRQIYKTWLDHKKNSG